MQRERMQSKRQHNEQPTDRQQLTPNDQTALSSESAADAPREKPKGVTLSTARFLSPHLQDDSTGDIPDDNRRPEQPTVSVANQSPQPVSPEEEDDEESIEAYMQRLMQRVSGRRPEETAASVPTGTALQAGANHSQGALGNSSDGDNSVGKPAVPRVRVKPPELSADMAAMRELANTTARGAIATHESRSGRLAAITSFVMAAICGAFGIFLLLISAFGVGGGAATLGGLAVGAATAYFVARGLSLSFGQKRPAAAREDNTQRASSPQ